MRYFNFLTLTTVAVISLSACSSNNESYAYLGSRDDIIVTNKGDAPKLESVAKEKMAQEADIMIAKVEDPGHEAITQAATEIKTDEVATSVESGVVKVSRDAQPMQTVAMKANEGSQTASLAPAAGTPPAMPTGAQGDVPPNARPGECYAKVLIPAVTETKSERIQVSEEQKVLDRIIPARYETQTERMKVKEARQYWKAGHGPITKKNEVTGEILCLVEEPAEYKTIEKRVLISPEQPQYKMVAAQFETVTTKNVIQAESWEWRRILCETNLSTSSIMQIQRGLNAKGYNLAVDGRLGNATLNAINKYQLKNGLASRGITYETLSHMGVALTGA